MKPLCTVGDAQPSKGERACVEHQGPRLHKDHLRLRKKVSPEPREAEPVCSLLRTKCFEDKSQFHRLLFQAQSAKGFLMSTESAECMFGSLSECV